MADIMFDVVVVGAGPAGLQAALHAVRKKASVLVLGRVEQSSLYRAHVENYLCVGGKAEGAELLRIAEEQVRGFGVEMWAEDVLDIKRDDEGFLILPESARNIRAWSIVLAAGTARKKLKVKGEKELLGKGVSYCVDCDANFFRNQRVAVVGNESAAVDGAITLLEYASDVFLITRRPAVSDVLRNRLAESRVRVMEGAWVKEIAGETAVSELHLEDGSTLEVDGVFIELGAKGSIELANNLGVQLDMDAFTYIDVNRKQETNIPGIYAAGDITGAPLQMAKAVGEGCVAGWEAANYAKRMKNNR